MKKLTQSGFSYLEALLLLVIAGLLIFVGAYVTNAQKNTDKQLKVPKSNSSVKAVSVSTTVYKFPELGIQFDKPDTIKELTYDITHDLISQDRTQISAGLKDADYIAVQKKCDSDSGTTNPEFVPSFAAIGRVEGKYDKTKAEVTDGAFIKQFDGFYITYITPNGVTCATENDALKNKWISTLHKSQKTFADAFIKSVKPL